MHLDYACDDIAAHRTRAGLISALASPMNNAQSQVKDLGLNGKYRKVQLSYHQRFTDDNIDESCNDDLCASGTETPGRKVEVELDVCSQVDPLQIDTWELRNLCDPNDVEMRRRINSLFEAATRRANAQALALIGSVNTPLFGGGTPATIDLVQSGALNDDDFDRVITDLNDITSCGMPMVVGGKKWQQAMRKIQRACCNTTRGVNYEDLDGEVLWFYDQQIDSLLTGVGGGNVSFALSPGGVQFVEWMNNEGDNAPESDDIVQRDVVIDPFTGLRWNISVSKVACQKNPKYNITIWKDWTLHFVPADLFASADAFYQTRSFLKYEHA